MSGGGKDKKSNNEEQVVASNAKAPAIRSFGGGLDPAVTAQLKAAGLLGIMPSQSPFQAVKVPILQTPDQVELYLKSLGKTPTAASSSSSGGSSKPFVKYGSI
jgi:hypothetical protein